MELHEGRAERDLRAQYAPDVACSTLPGVICRFTSFSSFVCFRGSKLGVFIRTLTARFVAECLKKVVLNQSRFQSRIWMSSCGYLQFCSKDSAQKDRSLRAVVGIRSGFDPVSNS